MTALLAPTAAIKPGSLVYINGGKLKALGDGRVGGYLVMFGGPRDSQGEYFRSDVECHLDWYGGEKRPILYHHGLEEEDIIEEIGFTNTIRRDANGLWAEGRLNMADPRAKQIYSDVRAGKIGWSSGSAPHLSKVDDDQGIREWAIVEGSLTPTPAAGKRTTVQALKFNYSSTFTEPSKVTTQSAIERNAKEPNAGIESNSMVSRKGVTKTLTKSRNIMRVKNHIAMIDALESAGADADMILKVLRAYGEGEVEGGEMMADDVGDSEVIDPAVMSADEEDPTKDAGPVVEGDGGAEITDSGSTPQMTPPQQLPAPAAGSSKKKAQQPVTAEAVRQMVIREMNTQRSAPAASKAAGFSGRNPAKLNDRIADIKSQYHDLSAEDMAYAYMLYTKRKGGGRESIPIEPAFLHVMATKAMANYEDGKLILDPKVAKVTRAIATKADFNNTLVAGEGASWVPDLWSSQLWYRVRIDNNVAKNVEVFQMPSPTFEYPIESSDPTVYAVGQSDTDAEQTLATNVFTRSKLTVSKLQFTAAKTGLQVGFSTEIEEDSIIPFIPQLRAQAVRAFANSIDNNLLNSDSTTGTGNINYKGANTSAAPTANFLFGGGNGMRYNALVSNPTGVAVSGAGGVPTLAGIRSLRFRMISALNTYGINPEDLVIITDPFTYGKFLSIDEINVYMNNGRGATVNTGIVPAIDGTPVYASAEMNLSDSTGYVTSTNWNVLAAPSASNLGNFLIFAKNAWKVGYVRQVMTDVSYVPWNDSYILTMTARYAIGKKDTIASALTYNLLVT